MKKAAWNVVESLLNSLYNSFRVSERLLGYYSRYYNNKHYTHLWRFTTKYVFKRHLGGRAGGTPRPDVPPHPCEWLLRRLGFLGLQPRLPSCCLCFAPGLWRRPRAPTPTYRVQTYLASQSNNVGELSFPVFFYYCSTPPPAIGRGSG